MATDYKTIIKEVDQAFEENNPESFLAHCTEDLEWSMVGQTTTRGKAAIRQWMASMETGAAPTITNDVTIVEGEYAASFGNMTMEVERGKTASFAYCDIYRFRGDKIAQMRSFVLPNEAMQMTANQT